MTEEQKAKFCDEYCIFSSLANDLIEGKRVYYPPYDAESLQIECDNCPLNEVSNE